MAKTSGIDKPSAQSVVDRAPPGTVQAAGRDPEIRPSVPLLDLKQQYEPLRDSIESAMQRVCDSQQFILGPEVENFESGISGYCGTDFAIGVSSGTDALLIALMALDIGPGDSVVTSAYSFFATGGVIARLGARPVFCDIETDTFNLDAGAVEDFLCHGCRRAGDRVVDAATGGTVKAIMPVHLYGQMADMNAISELATQFGLFVVEDAAQAIGAELPDGRRAGSIGDVGCLSFFPSKNLGAFGDAGMCVTRSAALAERMTVLRVHGAAPADRYERVGGNFRLDALQAAVLNVKLAHLDTWSEARRANAARYSDRLRASGLPIDVPEVRPGFRHVFNQYVIRVDRRDDLRAWLAASGIGSAVYYPSPLHLQPCFRQAGYTPRDCPVAERAARRSLAIPVYPELTSEQQDRVVDCLIRFFDSER